LFALAAAFAAPARDQAPAILPNEMVIVLNSGDGTVSLIDRKTYKEVKRYPIGKEPHHLMMTPDDKELIVANATSNELVFLDPVTGIEKHRLRRISDPYQLGFSPNGKWFLSISLRLDRVDIYNAADYSLVKRIELGRTPSHVTFSKDSSMAFVTLQESNDIAAIDLNTQKVVWRLPVGTQPAGIYMTPDGKDLIVGVMGEDYFAVVDWRARKVVKHIVTGKGAHNTQSMGDGKHIFASNRVAGTVNIIQLSDFSVGGTVKIPNGPDDMELTRDGKELWVTSRWSHRVYVVDMPTLQVKKIIPVGHSPHGIYFQSHAPRV
jgi:YVTN family beta-propeller protein